MTQQSRTLHDSPPPGLPGSIELEQTPFFPQTSYQCGPAALATVLASQGVDITPDELTERLYVPALHGSLPQEITATARNYGMLAYPLQASLEALLTEIAHGNPVLVFQNRGLRWLPQWHYAVAIGYRLDRDEIILRSGTTRRWHTTLSTFERTWARGHYWAQVIVPAGNIPATARVMRYLQAAHDLETSGQNAAAHDAFQAAIRQWPDSALAWMGYGNNRYADADPAAAEAAFRQATVLAPADPGGWNNLAYALLHTGCPQQARLAARCALALSPDSSEYRDTLAEIDASASGDDDRHCRETRCSLAAD